MTPASHIETERLRLQPCIAEDVHALHALWTNAEVRRYLWDNEVISRERAAEVVAGSLNSFSANGFGVWTVQLRNVPEIIGFCGVRQAEYTKGAAELLCGLAPECRGRGLATEASLAILGYAFEKLGLERVLGITDAPNAASLRLIQRLGMEFEKRDLINGRENVFYTISRKAFFNRNTVRVYTAEAE